MLAFAPFGRSGAQGRVGVCPPMEKIGGDIDTSPTDAILYALARFPDDCSHLGRDEKYHRRRSAMKIA